MKTVATIALIALFTGLSACTSYPTASRGMVETHSDNLHMRLVFTDYDRQHIFRYFGHPRRPHGRIPPGHYKRFHRHKPLPRGLHPRPIPRELDRRLSPLPSGYVRVIIGDDIAIMNTRTRVIYDVIWSIR